LYVFRLSFKQLDEIEKLRLIRLAVNGLARTSTIAARLLYGANGWFTNLTFSSVAPLHIYEADSYPEVGLVPDVPLYELIWRSPELLKWVADR
jgi:hypothetical protein